MTCTGARPAKSGEMQLAGGPCLRPKITPQREDQATGQCSDWWGEKGKSAIAPKREAQSTQLVVSEKGPGHRAGSTAVGRQGLPLGFWSGGAHNQWLCKKRPRPPASNAAVGLWGHPVISFLAISAVRGCLHFFCFLLPSPKPSLTFLPPHRSMSTFGKDSLLLKT